MMNASPNSLLNSAISSSSCNSSIGSGASNSSNNNAIAQANIHGAGAGSSSGSGADNVVAATVTIPSSTSTSSILSSSNNTSSNDTLANKSNTAQPPPPPTTTTRSGGGSSVMVPNNNGPPQPKALGEFHRNNSSNSSDIRQRTPNVAHEQLSKTNLYIRGLQATTKDHDLHEMCNQFGHITSTKAILDKSTGCCRGYGFVEFVDLNSAELAVRELTKSGIQAQMAKISSSYSHNTGNQHHRSNHQPNHHHNNNNHQHQYINCNQKSNNKNGGYNSIHNNGGGSQHNHNSSSGSSHKNHADPTNLYIANLPPNMCEPELEELLSNYGNIVSTRILRDEGNNPRGVGFARMESRDRCEEIIEQLNGRPYRGSSEPLVVKFADGGNKKRQHYNSHQHHNNNNQHNHLANHDHHKVNQDEDRWQDNTNPKELSGIQSYDNHRANMSHSNQPPDLATMGAMRMQPGFPPDVTTGGAYPPQLGPPSSVPQWIHPAGGQPYIMPPQMTQTGGLSPSNQAAAAVAMHYGHIPHLAAQMQGLQIAHAPAHVGGYLPPQHQWPALWPHPIPQQSHSSMGRLSTGPMQTGSASASIVSQHSPQFSPVQQPPHQSQPQRLAGQQQQAAAIDNKLHVSVPL